METLSLNYNCGEKKKQIKWRVIKGWTELTKIWPVVEQCNREGGGPCVCFDLPFIGSAGGSPDLHSFHQSTWSFINDSVLTNHNDYW